MYPELTLEIGKSLYIFKTYTVFIFLSVVFGLVFAYIRLRKKMHYAFLFLLGLIISFIIGARLLNYLVNYSFYQNNSGSLFELKAIGFSFYGGILASIIYLLVIYQIFNLNLWTLTDEMILPFGISFFIMRIGCFLNGCCFGKTTTCFFGVQLPKETFDSIFHIFSDSIRIHPTQLYEGFGALLGVILLSIFRKRIKTQGLMTLYYGIYLTSLRWFVLYFRRLQYDPWVLTLFYPILYFTLIIIGLFSIWQLKYRSQEKINFIKYTVTNLDKT